MHWNIISLSHRTHDTFFSLSLVLLPYTNFLRLSRFYSYLAYVLYTLYKTVFLVRIEYFFFRFFFDWARHGIYRSSWDRVGYSSPCSLKCRNTADFRITTTKIPFWFRSSVVFDGVFFMNVWYSLVQNNLDSTQLLMTLLNPLIDEGCYRWSVKHDTLEMRVHNTYVRHAQTLEWYNGITHFLSWLPYWGMLLRGRLLFVFLLEDGHRLEGCLHGNIVCALMDTICDRTATVWTYVL